MFAASGYSWRKLEALAAAIEDSAAREPYPRLAQLMQSLNDREARFADRSGLLPAQA